MYRDLSLSKKSSNFDYFVKMLNGSDLSYLSRYQTVMRWYSKYLVLRKNLVLKIFASNCIEKVDLRNLNSFFGLKITAYYDFKNLKSI